MASSDLCRAIVAAALLGVALPPPPACALDAMLPAVDAEITIRKDPPAPGTRRSRPGTSRVSRATRRRPAHAPPSPPPSSPPKPAAAVGGAVRALGEGWSDGGTLHLPGTGGRGTTLDIAATPLVELEDGSRLIIDVGGSIPPALAAAIGKRWPGHRVLSFPAGAHPRDVLGGVLGASGYATVAPGAPIVFGGEVRVRLRPDFVVLKSDDDLLDGQTRALSVVDSPLDAIPEELRDLAGEHRVLVDDLPRDPAAAPPAAGWRDPVGGVTTIETANRGLIYSEIAAAAGIAPSESESGTANAGADLRAAVGALLRSGGAAAIGPTVDFTRPTAAGGPSRFTVSVPGWLVDRGDRRLLVTGASLAAPLRLLLTREGIDVLEYRLRK